jgi:hypothetical protein
MKFMTKMAADAARQIKHAKRDALLGEVEIAEAQGLPESQAWLHKVRTEAKKNGYSIFAIVEDPAHPLGGGSITTVLPGHTGDAIRNARAAHVAWEQAHGYDPAHSWEKSATDAKGLVRGARRHVRD